MLWFIGCDCKACTVYRRKGLPPCEESTPVTFARRMRAASEPSDVASGASSPATPNAVSLLEPVQHWSSYASAY